MPGVDSTEIPVRRWVEHDQVDTGHAPGGADLHTMDGDIEVASAKKFVKAKTMGGDIEVPLR